MTTDANAFFREMTLRICGNLDLDLALERAFEYAAEHLPVDAMALGYYDPAEGAIRMLSWIGLDDSCCNESAIGESAYRKAGICPLSFLNTLRPQFKANRMLWRSILGRMVFKCRQS